MQLRQPHQQQLLQQQTSSAAMDRCDKCEKCNQLFFSPLNYRRHARVHRRTLGTDKEDVVKEKAHLMAFFRKLSMQEAAELLSLKGFSIEDFSGDVAMKELAGMVESRRGVTFGGVPIVPPSMLKAGTTLLSMATGKEPLSTDCRAELFESLHEATEGTFLRGGTGISFLRFVYQGGAKRVALEERNLVAHLAFLLEHKLVQAWMADKEAEALKCQQALVEEEEAAQQKRAKIQERKRAKKIRLKEARDRERKGIGNINEYVDGDWLPEGSSGPGKEEGEDEEAGLESPSGTEVGNVSLGVAGEGPTKGTDQWQVQQSTRGNGGTDEPCFPWKEALKDKVADGGGDGGSGPVADVAGDLGKGEGGKRNLSLFGGAIEAPQLKKLAQLATRAPEPRARRGEDTALISSKTREGRGGRVVGSPENAGRAGEGIDLGEGRLGASDSVTRKFKGGGSEENADDFLECLESGEYGLRRDEGGGHKSMAATLGVSSAKRSAHPHSDGVGSGGRPSSGGALSHHQYHARERLHPSQNAGSSGGGLSGSASEGLGGISGVPDLGGGGSWRISSAGLEVVKGASVADVRLGRSERSDSARIRHSSIGIIGGTYSSLTEFRASGIEDGWSGKVGKVRVEGGAGGSSAGLGSGMDVMASVSNAGFVVGHDSEFPPLPKAQMPARGRKVSLGSSDAIRSLEKAGSGQKYRLGADTNKHLALECADARERSDSDNLFTPSNAQSQKTSRNAGCTPERAKTGEKGNEGKGGKLGREPTSVEHEARSDRRAGVGNDGECFSAPASEVIVVGQIPVVLNSGWEGHKSSGGPGRRASAGQEHRKSLPPWNVAAEREGVIKNPVWVSRGGAGREKNAIGLVTTVSSSEDPRRNSTCALSRKEEVSPDEQPSTPPFNGGSSGGGWMEDVCGGMVISSVRGLVIGEIVTPVKLEMGSTKEALPGEGGEAQERVVYEQQPPCCGTVHPTIIGGVGRQGGTSVCLGMQGEVLPMGVCLAPQTQPLASPYLPWGVNVQPAPQVSVRSGVAIPAQSLYTPVPHCGPHNAVHVPISVQMTGSIPEAGLGMGVGLGVNPVQVLHMQRGGDGRAGVLGQMTVLEGGRHDLPGCDTPMNVPHGPHSKEDSGIERWSTQQQPSTPKNVAVPTQVHGLVVSQTHGQGVYHGQPQVRPAISRHGYAAEGSSFRTGMTTNVNVAAQSGCPGGMVAVGHPVWHCEGEPTGERIAPGSSGVVFDNKRRWEVRGQDSRLSRQALWGSQYGKPWSTKVWRPVGVVGSQNHGEGGAMVDSREEGNTAGGQNVDTICGSRSDSLRDVDNDGGAVSASNVMSPGTYSRASAQSGNPMDSYDQGHAGEDQDKDRTKQSLSHSISVRREIHDTDSLLLIADRVEMEATRQEVDASEASGDGQENVECSRKGPCNAGGKAGKGANDGCGRSVHWEDNRSSEPKIQGDEEVNPDSGTRLCTEGPMHDPAAGGWQNRGGKEMRWERRWRPSNHGNGSHHAARFLSERWAAAIEDSEAFLYNGDVSDGEDPISSNNARAGLLDHHSLLQVSDHNEHHDCVVDVCGSSGSRGGAEDTSASAVEMHGWDGAYWGGGPRSRGGVFGGYENTRYMSRGSAGRGRGAYRGDRSDSYYDGDVGGHNGSYYTERYYGAQGGDTERYRGKGGRSGPGSDRRGPVSSIGTAGASSVGVSSSYNGPGRRRGASGPVERGSRWRWRSDITTPYDHKAYARKQFYAPERDG